MKIRVKNKEITLDKRHYLSAGGEGQVYANNGLAYKIYLEPSHMIPEPKIGELSVLKHSSIIKPIDIIQNINGKNIGYTMKYVNKTVALCQLFTKAFKNRNNLKEKDILLLVDQLRDGIKHCHNNNILIVDLNEFNFLVDSSKFNKLYFIDVDSYQTQHYPATAIMDSIRDRQAKKWTTETDWFSFAILSFQLFVGIHPFKGKHPIYKTMDERMINNISVFDSKVKVPPVSMSFDVIPESYKQWFKVIFNSGKRIAPPFGDIAVTIVPAKIKIIKGNDNFIITVISEYEGNIIHYIDGNVLTDKGLKTNTKMDKKVAPYAQIAIASKLKNIYTAIIKNKNLLIYNVTTGKDFNCPYQVDKMMSYDSRIYVKMDNNICELGFIEVTNTVTLKNVCSVLSQATQMFDGVIIQNLLGSFYISIFPEQGYHYQIKISELEGYRIVDAKYDKKILIVVGEKKGKYDQLIFKFNNNFNQYSSRRINNISYTGINFTVLDNGICVFETHEGYIELFRNHKDENDIKLIKDTTIAGSKLFNKGNETLFAKDNKLYSVKLK